MNKTFALLAILLTVLVSATPAHAVRIECYNKTILGFVSSSRTTTDTAHVLTLTACSQTISGTSYSLCPGNMAYIEFDDKEIYTQALLALSKGLAINASVELNATAKGSTDIHGTKTCKIVSLWY